MRKLIIAVLVLISLESFAQPTNYTWYKQRIRQYSLMLDSTLYIPRYNGTPSGVRANETSAIDGAVAVDTANGRQYFYYNGSWRRLANYSELGVDSIWREAGKDSIFYIKAGTTYKIKDSTGGGGATPTLQQVLTAGSTLTTENEINLNRNALLIVDSADNRTFVTIDGQAGNQRIVLDADDGSLYASSIDLSANTSSGASLDIACHEIGYESLAISFDGDEEKINYTSPRHSFISDRGGSYTNLVITQDSIQLLPHLGKLNIDSLRTWSAVADTTYKKPMTWDTRNGRWEYASNWFGGGGGTPGGSNKQFQYNNSSSFGGSGNLTQETNQVLVTATDAATAPFVVKGASAHSANFFEIQNNSGTNQVFVNSSGQIRSVQNIVAFNGATEQVTIGYSGLGGVAGIDIGASSDAAIYRSAANQLTAHVQQWRWTGRAQTNQGADVASAAGAIALGTDGNSFEITGTAAITLISNVSWQNGSEVTLLFTSTATLTDGTANSGTDIGMELSGNTNFTASAGSTLTLILSEIGGTQRWREVSRSVN